MEKCIDGQLFKDRMLAAPSYNAMPPQSTGIEYVMNSNCKSVQNYQNWVCTDELAYIVPNGYVLSDSRGLSSSILYSNSKTATKMLSVFKQRSKDNYLVAKPIFLSMLSIALTLPLKAFNIDYSVSTRTLFFRLLLTNDLRISLNKSVDTISESEVAYSISYRGNSLVISIADVLELQNGLIKLVNDLQKDEAFRLSR